MSALYSAPFALLAAVPALYYAVDPAASVVAIVALLIWLLLGELALSKRMGLAEIPHGRFYRVAPLLYIPAQLSVTAWAIVVACSVKTSPLVYAELALTIGVLTGVFGVLAAHEMVHSPRRSEQQLGALMLTGMMYRHFRIAHVYGHHRWAATEKDAATARLSEGFYAYLVRALPQQFLESHRFEKRRCARKTFALLRNRVHQDVVVMLCVFLVIFLWAGLAGLVFFVAESAIAVFVLELFNYIAHYGLLRARRTGGAFEPHSDGHSWNSSNPFANKLILNMGRHSDHHRRPTTAYQLLRPVDEAPELPLGYAGSILLALFPPLWRRVMDPLVLRVRARGGA